MMTIMISSLLQNTEHPLPITAAGPQRFIPTRRHRYKKNGGRARRRTAPSDLAQNWANPDSAEVRMLMYTATITFFYRAVEPDSLIA